MLAKLFATLNAVQSKLAFLESENTESRRRVHELELELEETEVQFEVIDNLLFLNDDG